MKKRRSTLLVAIVSFFRRCLVYLPWVRSCARFLYKHIFLFDDGKRLIKVTINGDVYTLAPGFANCQNKYEPHVFAWLKQWLRPADVFWDVGANVGLFVLQAARLVGDTGAIVAFEASPYCVSILTRHIRGNGLERRVTIFPGAVDQSSEAQQSFVLVNKGNSDMNMLQSCRHSLDSGFGEFSTISVPATSLDDYVSGGNRIPRLIKIDVEGAELRVLRGAAHLLTGPAAPILILAHHSLWESQEGSAELMSLLTSAGYQILDRMGNRVEHMDFDEYICLPPQIYSSSENRILV